MNNLSAIVGRIGPGKLLGVGALFLGLLFTLIFGLNVLNRPVLTPIYTNLSPSEAANIVSNLESAQIPVSVSADGSVVSIPNAKFAEARMILAQAGLPKAATTGWELFDSSGGLGMTSFSQKVNRLRALEGELARSIMTMSRIENARVHLVLPEREAFSREAPAPTASVIVTSSASSEIERNQALAIRHLVSSAIPNLAPSSVTVLSSTGEILLADDRNGVSSDGALQGAKAAIEESYRKSIEKMLSARVGAGNARVQVAVELNTDRVVSVSEEYNPDQQVVRSQEMQSETEENAQSDQSNVSVDNNLPNAGADPAGGSMNTTRRNRLDEITNYDISSVKTERVKEPGSINRVSVAVLVNGIYNRTDAGVVYEERSAEEIARIEDLVKGAIGYSDDRGDLVHVDSLRFMDYSMELGDPVGTSFADVLKDLMPNIIQWLFGLAIVTVIVLFGVRPAIARLLPAPVQADEAQVADVAALSEGQQAAAAGAGAQPAVAPAGSEIIAGGEEDNLVSINQVRGGVRKRKIDAVASVVDQSPEDARRILQQWVNSK